MSVKLIIALDFDNLHEAFKLVDQLNPNECALKVGNQMFTLFGPELIKALVAKKFKVFLDLKFHDIPNTVAHACKAAAELGVWMTNVHAAGGLTMLQAAREALHAYDSRPLLIAVTLLTSMSENEAAQTGLTAPLQEHVQKLALLAQKAGLDGVVSSALEVPTIKKNCGHKFLTVTPGIRLPSHAKDDQTRIVTPENAWQLGSDYLVIGRPVTRAPNPRKVIDELLLTCTYSHG
ncbi:orotidine-5'-phosphate decarboxylase [Legionella septentrionalis]|uniref:Orotidine 5'-phosphate decarboxylase n=1 Tax=Legionella septentrionalis TaxID=2498109 RepID=A0A3S0XU00_9GAMM|nr:orotidine-5'-phosphate decarboxylase [Legionella septentrionalis]RUQ89712.1 orotidine-5'-phosphate decarboxylase [Legionella septentrionalis]